MSIASPQAEELRRPSTPTATLVDIVCSRAQVTPDLVAHRFLQEDGGEEVLTFAALDLEARTIAANLQAQIALGDRVLLVYPPGLEFVAAFFGCLYAGAAAVPIYPPKRNRLGRLQAVFEDARVAIALTTRRTFDTLEHHIRDTPGLEKLPWLATDNLDTAQEWTPPALTPESLALLQYTSGSTAEPKGVMVSHANLMYNGDMVKLAYPDDTDTTFVSWLPVYHDMGLIGNLLQPAYLGATCILMAPATFLASPYLWLEAITRFKAHTSGAPNFAYDLCVDRITEEQKRSLDLSSWSIAYNGSEPVRYATIERFTQAFASCGFRPEAFYPCYGMAETTLLVTGGLKQSIPVRLDVLADDLEKNRIAEATQGDAAAIRTLVGCGTTHLGQRIVIVDPESMMPCAPDEVGEIWVSGDTVTQGYWNKPEATEQYFRARLADSGEGPFLRTGDLGFVRDEEVFITGRLKDMILIRGRNLYPHDIELTVSSCHDALNDWFVISFATTSDGADQLVIVAEVARQWRSRELEPVLDAIRETVVEEYDVAPESIVLIRPATLPRTSSGKLQRSLCRKQFLEGSLAVVAAWHRSAGPGEVVADSADLESRLLAVAARALRITPDQIDTSKRLSYYGADSLQQIELACEIEQELGLKIPTDLLSGDITVRELLSAFTPNATPADFPGANAHPASQGDTTALQSIADFSQARFPQRDLFARCRQYQEIQSIIRSAPGYQYFSTRHSSKGVELQFEVAGQAPRPFISFAGYDYLGMASNDEVIEAAHRAHNEFGVSPAASEALAGRTTIHRALEGRLAELLQKEAVLLFTSGFPANVGALNGLLRENDLVLADILSHASLHDGISSSNATALFYRHNDLAYLDQLLRDHRPAEGGALIVTEGLFSMDATVPDLRRLVEIAATHGARVMNDEAHSFGVLGPTGLGAMERFDAFNEVDIVMGSLAKAPGGGGGFIAGPSSVIHWLRSFARASLFSVALAPSLAAAALQGIEVQRRSPEILARLRENIARFTSGLRELGWPGTFDSECPIIPLVVGDQEILGRMTELLLARGIFANQVIFPAVTKNTCRFRFSLSALHTAEHIDKALDAIAAAASACDFKPAYALPRIPE